MKKVATLFCALLLTLTTRAAMANDCGKPLNRGEDSPRASDALFILRSALGSEGCRLEDCDVDADCNVHATDALRTLKKSVGQSVHLDCKAECETAIPCEENEAPVCNGVCPEGTACVQSDGSHGRRVTVCHVPPGQPGEAHTLVLPPSAVNAHLDHGDHEGPCDGTEGDGDQSGSGDESDLSGCNNPHGCPGKGHGSGNHMLASEQGPEPECVCEPLPATTTTSTSSTLPSTTTTLGGETTTTVPETTTTVGEPTTTVPEQTTTTVGQPTTTQPEQTTTTVGEPTTTVPEQTTTTVAEPTTTQPEPTTTTVAEPTTTQPEPTTTTVAEPTTTLPESTTTTLAETTTTTLE